MIPLVGKRKAWEGEQLREEADTAKKDAVN